MKLPKNMRKKRFNESLSAVLEGFIDRDILFYERRCDGCQKIKICHPIPHKEKKLYLCNPCHATVLKKVIVISEQTAKTEHNLDFFKSAFVSSLEEIIRKK